MAAWLSWIFGIWKEYAVAEWFVWVFRIWVIAGIWIMATSLRHILVCVRDISNKMDKLDGKRDALPSIDSFLASIRSAGSHPIPDDSDDAL